jgi:HD-like signal output (HDOD) protein
MDKLEIFKSIAEQVAHGELAFPTNVSASLKIQKTLNDPDCTIENAAKLIQAEPLLSARVVAIANSVAFNRAGNEVTTVRAALTRVGFRTMRTLASAVVVRQFGSKVADPALHIKSVQLWEHTAHVAALAQVLARRLTKLDPETAMFAGLMHEIGGFYLLSRAEEFPGLLDGDIDEWGTDGETEVGRAVLQKLVVPDAVVEAVESLWLGFRVLPPKRLGDILLLANDLAPVASPLDQREGASAEDCAVSIDFASGEGTLSGILEESAEEVRSLTAALL